MSSLFLFLRINFTTQVMVLKMNMKLKNRKASRKSTVGTRAAFFMRLLTTSLFIVSSASNADHLSIQVASLTQSNPIFLKEMEAFGKVQTISSGNFTRVLVGNYHDQNSANQALERLVQRGLNDAFITKLTANTEHPHSHDQEHSLSAENHGHTHLPDQINQKIAELTPEQREKVVLLDGKLHLKEGDQFIPLN